MRNANGSNYALIGMGIITAGLITGLNIPNKDKKKAKPNFIIIYTDDQGYNDLGCYGSKTIKTPRLDQMAREGVRFTAFYAQPVSGPSRGALMTGRYPLRIGGGWTVNSDEVTIAEVLKKEGYSTGCVGKWDMSHRRELEGSLPNDQGFEYYFGTLGANDNGVVQIYRNKKALYSTEDMGSLTNLYTEEAISFIKNNKEKPFFLYLAHSMPHVKLDASPQFKGKSAGELYGDVIEELDWNVGRVFDVIREFGLDNNTYILFASDNGPWTSREELYRSKLGGQLGTGNSKPLRSSKGSPYEGGFRVPCIFWGPGRVKAGLTQNGMLSTLDIKPTFAKLAGAEVSDHKILDGYNQIKFMTGETKKSTRNLFYYHIEGELQAIRYNNWKLMLPGTSFTYRYVKDPKRLTPELYDLENDISESINVAEKYPAVTKQLLKMAIKGPNKLDPSAKP
jgi:arylsulfatase A-like enzyme